MLTDAQRRLAALLAERRTVRATDRGLLEKEISEQLDVVIAEWHAARGYTPSRHLAELEVLELVRREREQLARREREAAEAALPRGLGEGLAAADSAEVSGITFTRTTAAVTVDLETYTSADGTMVLHQSRQDRTWMAREVGWGSFGFERGTTPEGALTYVFERRARETAQLAAGATS